MAKKSRKAKAKAVKPLPPGACVQVDPAAWPVNARETRHIDHAVDARPSLKGTTTMETCRLAAGLQQACRPQVMQLACVIRASFGPVRELAKALGALRANSAGLARAMRSGNLQQRQGKIR